jgi:beta-glucanase (GH16 family)/Ca2+-binding RTX toxin-like protein
VNARGVVMPESATEEARIVGTAAGGETINAPAGNSSLSGEGGGDVLIGNSQDNRHWITNPNDRVIEQPNGGIDTEIGWTSIKLAANVENLIVHGDFNYAVGNELDNLIVVDGRQWVYGGRGDDVLVGGTTQGATFVVKAGEGSDVIYNWNANDQLQLQGYGLSTADQIRSRMTQQGSDVTLSFGNGEKLIFRGTTLDAFSDRQFLLPLDTAKLGAVTFQDDFNTLQLIDPSLATGTWRADFGGNLKDQWAYTLVSNGETQVYAQPGFQGRGEKDIDVNPFSVSNGVLTISAQKVDAEDAYAAWNRDFTSGMLNTLGSFEQKYGYFEIRAEMPTAQGTWPAFWMMTHPFTSGVEADIFEGLAATPNVDYRRAFGGSETLYDNALKIDPSGFHTYGLLWTAQTVTFYYDGVAVLQGATPATWTQPMALILNMAVGGWGGTADPSQFPATLKVDYIKAYALADGTTQVVHETPEAPAATLREHGAVTSGAVNSPVAFADSGQAVTSAHIAVYGAKPATLPPGKTFVIWEDSGAVFGAVSDGTKLDTPTPLMAGTASQFTGTGTWLTTGKIVFGYLMPDGAGKAAWAMVFDPVKHSFTRQELGPSTGDIDFVATQSGGFAASWDAPDGSTMGRGYDEYAYGGDIPGWYGPARHLAGDLVGVTAGGQLIAQTGSGQQLYDILGASITAAPAHGNPTTGDDNLQAVPGFTEIHALAGNDTLIGSSGEDYFRGDEGNDSLSGGDAHDDLQGNMGNDTESGGAGGDFVVGGKDDDVLYGDDGDDVMNGNLGNDSVDGGTGADIVRGGQGDDVLKGGAGDDWISGDRGNDILTGGAGADIFHMISAGGHDRITDFSRAEGDRLQVEAGLTWSVSQIGADTVVTLSDGSDVVLSGVSMGSLSGGWIFTG